ncbi:MAG: hypothetical protein MJ165_01220 [Alphaproteobacteria bacterium]|nr:hypothetical protein [Alphaproteobacteria bacterium]
MKKLFLIFVALIMVLPAFSATVADGDKSKPVSVSYVKEAYNALDSAKQAKLSTSNVSVSDDGDAGKPVTEVTASDGKLTLKRAEITVPVGSASSPTSRASIWIE